MSRAIQRTEHRAAAYQALRRAGYSQPQAAEVMGLSVRTAARYEARSRAAGWVPPPPSATRRPLRMLARIEDYRWLLGLGETRAAAAVRLGVCETTLARYERKLRGAA